MRRHSRAEPSRSAGPLQVLCCSGSLDGGGSERQLWQLVCHLDRQRFQPSVHLLYRRGIYLDRLPDDVPVSAFWGPHNQNQRFWPTQIHRQQVAQLTRLLQSNAIDLLYDRTFHMTLVSGAATRNRSVPRVSVIVSPPSRDFAHSRERFRWWKRWLLAKAYRQTGCTTIAVSSEVADDAARYFRLDRQQLLVLPNPIDVQAVRQAALDPSPISAKLSAERPHLVVVGRLSAEKGQRLALQALHLSRQQNPKDNWHLDLIGDGPDRLELQRLVVELGLVHDVTFHGFQANPHALMQQATLVCVPSLYEGLPNVALEAMALGAGLLATDCSGSLRELIGRDQRGQLIPVGDAVGLAQALHNRLQQTALWQQRCELAEAWVRQNHAIEPWMEKMQSLFQDLTKEHAGR